MAVLTDDQQMVKDIAQAWVRDRIPVAAVRSVRSTHIGIGHDPALFAEMADMGWTGMLVNEDHGGFAFDHRSFGIVMEELGRQLAISPLLSSALLAASALTLGGTKGQQDRWLPGIAAGTTIGTLAIEESHRHAPLQTAFSAQRVENGWTLTGTKRAVLDGIAAQLFVVVARTSGVSGDAKGLTLFLCPAETVGVTKRALKQIDSHGDAIVDFEAVQLPLDAVIGEPDGAMPLLDLILDRGRAALAAEMLGASQQAFATTMDYLKTRVQFGHPIGAFQALQHRAADMLNAIELTRSAVETALAAIDEGRPEMPALVSLAKAMAGQTMRAIAREMIQMHGGIGMTDEHDAGLYLKRAHVADMTFGNSAFHRERYAALSSL